MTKTERQRQSQIVRDREERHPPPRMNPDTYTQTLEYYFTTNKNKLIFFAGTWIRERITIFCILNYIGKKSIYIYTYTYIYSHTCNLQKEQNGLHGIIQKEEPREKEGSVK